jgi:hypothetical protein
MTLRQALDVEFLKSDKIISSHQKTRNFVQLKTPLAPDALIHSAQAFFGFQSILAAFLFAREMATDSGKSVLYLFYPARVSNLAAT